MAEQLELLEDGSTQENLVALRKELADLLEAKGITRTTIKTEIIFLRLIINRLKDV